MARILVLGADGYLGWPTAMYLSKRGHEVVCVDNGAKRRWEREVGVAPLNALPSLIERCNFWEESTGERLRHYVDGSADICHHDSLTRILKEVEPDTIIHYAEQPSAPFSMASADKSIETQRNNVLGTLNLLWCMREVCPKAHLVKLGTMGEYGTPNIDIEEGYLDVEHNGRKDTVLFPKKPGSFYHLSKVHDSHNMFFACRTWGLSATDLNQGVVYGIETDEMYEHQEGDGWSVDGALMNRLTSFHYDAIFGTALNRFCTQAVVERPLTVYGSGQQKRAFLNIKDTLRCVELACLNPAEPGEMRIFNQFTEVFSILELAQLVAGAARDSLGVQTEVRLLENPRVESTKHHFNPKAEKLIKLGLKPRLLGDELIKSMLRRIHDWRDRIDTDSLVPRVTWR